MKNTFKIFASLGFACVLSQAATSLAADESSCYKLSATTVPKVCAGDIVRSREDARTRGPHVTGKVVKIESAISEDGRPMGVLTVQTNDGVSRLTTRGFVFVTPGTCVQDTKSQGKICLDESFKSEDDGRVYKVIGFSVSDGESLSSDGVLVRAEADKSDWERTMSAHSIYESHAVAANGVMSRVGSCDSEIPFLDKMAYGHLPSCATKEAATRLLDSCRRYCAGKGGLKKGDFAAVPSPLCDVSPNMFPPHKKVCTTTLSATCRCDQ